MEDPAALIADAAELGILLSQGQMEQMERFHGPWTWGPIARALMFGYQADRFADLDTERATRREREATDVRLLPAASGPAIQLPPPPRNALGDVLAQRRTRRAFGARPIELEVVAACLHAGFGITGERVVNGRRLPLTAAPASGALNTYDAVVLARTVSDLEPGTYRYLPAAHELAREQGAPAAFDRLVGGQPWAARAACAIVLVADLRRQASKYAYPTTLAAVLIEAGARVELLLLQAEAAALSAATVGLAGVGAFDRELAAEAGLWGETSMTVPICAVLLGHSADAPEMC